MKAEIHSLCGLCDLAPTLACLTFLSHMSWSARLNETDGWKEYRAGGFVLSLFSKFTGHKRVLKSDCACSVVTFEKSWWELLRCIIVIITFIVWVKSGTVGFKRDLAHDSQ